MDVTIPVFYNLMRKSRYTMNHTDTDKTSRNCTNLACRSWCIYVFATYVNMILKQVVDIEKSRRPHQEIKVYEESMHLITASGTTEEYNSSVVGTTTRLPRKQGS